MSWANLHELGQLTIRAHGQRGVGSPVNQPIVPSNPFDNLRKAHRTSNSISFHTFNPKFGWILRLILTLLLLLLKKD